MTSRRVLIVDDEASIRNLLKANLQDCDIFEADCAQDALALTASVNPDLVILDLGLPDMSGLEVLRRLRKWTRVPVVVLTVDDLESQKVALLDAGADDYLTK